MPVIECKEIQTLAGIIFFATKCYVNLYSVKMFISMSIIKLLDNLICDPSFSLGCVLRPKIKLVAVYRSEYVIHAKMSTIKY